jgi:hypothetical protein
MKHEVIQTSAADTRPPFEPATFWSQFRRGTAMVKGVRLHYFLGINIYQKTYNLLKKLPKKIRPQMSAKCVQH